MCSFAKSRPQKSASWYRIFHTHMSSKKHKRVYISKNTSVQNCKKHHIISRSQLHEISFLNVQTLPESPTQDGTDAILLFFVNLPGGTMPLDLLTTIFVSSPNIISRRSSAYVTEDIRNNTVSVLLPNYRVDQVTGKIIIFAIKLRYWIIIVKKITNSALKPISHN